MKYLTNPQEDIKEKIDDFLEDDIFVHIYKLCYEENIDNKILILSIFNNLCFGNESQLKQLNQNKFAEILINFMNSKYSTVRKEALFTFSNYIIDSNNLEICLQKGLFVELKNKLNDENEVKFEALFVYYNLLKICKFLIYYRIKIYFIISIHFDINYSNYRNNSL